MVLSKQIPVDYLTPGTLDITRLLAPPPDDAVALAGELDAVRQALTMLPAFIALAQADTAVNIYRFEDVLGPSFKAANLPLTDAFFVKVYSYMDPFLLLTKDSWRRPRPFEMDKAILPPDTLLASTVDRTGTSPEALSAKTTAVRYSYAYPSGHAAFGTLVAILLADMVPEQKLALFRRGWEYGEVRVIGGLHYPSDIEAGRVLATVLVAALLQDKSFRADLGTARTELRKVLGLAIDNMVSV